ncbi:MAG: hypothetical protein ACC645_15165 [Pirellulales bacterium]
MDDSNLGGAACSMGKRVAVPGGTDRRVARRFDGADSLTNRSGPSVARSARLALGSDGWATTVDSDDGPSSDNGRPTADACSGRGNRFGSTSPARRTDPARETAGGAGVPDKALSAAASG